MLKDALEPGEFQAPFSAAGLAPTRSSDPAWVGERLTLAHFRQLSGMLGGYPYVKVVVDRHAKGQPAGIHFLNSHQYEFHADYIGDHLLKISRETLEAQIDRFNESVYLDPNRRFYLGILSLHRRGEKSFFALESVEIDTMDAAMIREFYTTTKSLLDPMIPLLFKPANHVQETAVAAIPTGELPRVLAHELFSSARFIALNPGVTRGRLRAFRTEVDYRAAATTIEWHDIVVMHRVPDDIPRVSGIINAHHTTPLSHTNVLASGWGIPNCIQLGIFEQVDREALNGKWVEYGVETSGTQAGLRKIDKPVDTQKPAWSVQTVRLEEPQTSNTPIVSLDALRMGDRYKYGTKAANLGELRHVLENGSERLLGFYRVKRPPRPNLLPYLARFTLGEHANPDTADLSRAAWQFLRRTISVPRGIALPFSLQQEFLESSPRIQQMIGKLKMALELNVREVDSLCLSLQQLIRQTRLPDRARYAIDAQIAANLSGVSSFVVRSSSNAEDLENFSAAGIYESINHVTTVEGIFQSIKEVWASLLSPRSVRLRQQVGISLDDCYMGVVVQEEVPSRMGGVIVTTHPMARGDFRNVFINASTRSAVEVVQGSEIPHQYLYNTVEGGGRTVSLGEDARELGEASLDRLQQLAYAGRLLQSHFSPDYTFSAPVDIEWIENEEGLVILQLRPYAN